MGNTIFNNTPITTAATTLIKTGQGIFGGFDVQGGLTGTITVYDNIVASGKVIANYDTTNAIAPPYEYNTAFTIGCTVVTSAATKLTVLWK